MNVLYETACEHLAARNPKNVKFSEEFICRQCRQTTHIIGVQLMEFRAHCKQCGWSRYTGMAPTMASQAASRHMLNTRHINVEAGWAVNPAAKAERERIAKGNLL